MRRFAAVALPVLLAGLALAGCGAHPATGQGDRVVLLHGLGRSDLSMLLMERALQELGYEVVNVGYPSTEHSIQHLADKELRSALRSCCVDTTRTTHFVTHSMGGIVLRYYLDRHDLPNLGRVVMLSPPNQGSELADRLEIFEGILGPSMGQLGTGAGSVATQLGPVDYELGIIAGNRSLNPLFSRMIPGEDDGKVSVEETKVGGMADFLVVPHTHTYIMMSDQVIDQVAHFLAHGRFSADSAGLAPDPAGAAGTDKGPVDHAPGADSATAGDDP